MLVEIMIGVFFQLFHIANNLVCIYTVNKSFELYNLLVVVLILFGMSITRLVLLSHHHYPHIRLPHIQIHPIRISPLFVIIHTASDAPDWSWLWFDAASKSKSNDSGCCLFTCSASLVDDDGCNACCCDCSPIDDDGCSCEMPLVNWDGCNQSCCCCCCCCRYTLLVNDGVVDDVADDMKLNTDGCNDAYCCGCSTSSIPCVNDEDDCNPCCCCVPLTCRRFDKELRCCVTCCSCCT